MKIKTEKSQQKMREESKNIRREKERMLENEEIRVKVTSNKRKQIIFSFSQDEWQ